MARGAQVDGPIPVPSQPGHPLSIGRHNDTRGAWEDGALSWYISVPRKSLHRTHTHSMPPRSSDEVEEVAHPKAGLINAKHFIFYPHLGAMRKLLLCVEQNLIYTASRMI